MRRSWTCTVGAALMLFLPIIGEAQIERWVLGEGENDWESQGELLGGMWVVDGGLQPYELDPAINIAVGPKVGRSLADVFGNPWSGERSSYTAARLIPGIPEALGDNGYNKTVDGDTTKSVAIVSEFYYYNLGWELPINRVRFFPPEEGRTETDDRKRIEPGLPLKNAYPKTYVLYAATDGEKFKQGNFEVVLEENLNHRTRIADVRFPTQPLQFLFLSFPELGVISEVQFFGEGFVQHSRYLSTVIDLGEPVNFGRVIPYISGYRKEGIDAEPELDPDAQIDLSVETRTGRDDTPLVYHIVTELRTEREVSFAEWDKAPRASFVRPGAKGSVRHDVDNWSFWSIPLKFATNEGEQIVSPDNRRYLQLQFEMQGKDLFTYGRIDSLVIEYSPLLADAIVGEIALRDEPRPPGRKTKVTIGEEQIFAFDMRTEFTSDDRSGFNALRLRLPTRGEFIGLEMGEPLAPVQPDSVREEEGEIVVFFPTHQVTPANNAPLRLIFKTGVYSFNALFLGEVFLTGEETLPQSVDPGDANPEVSTNAIEVLAPNDQLEVLSNLEVGGAVLTPNGDGRNDRLDLSFSLLGVQTASVKFDILDLSGRKVRTLIDQERGEGRFTEAWDGKADGGTLVNPGIYLARISVDTDTGAFTRIRSIAVAY